jgi:hypothetical protein
MNLPIHVAFPVHGPICTMARGSLSKRRRLPGCLRTAILAANEHESRVMFQAYQAATQTRAADLGG